MSIPGLEDYAFVPCFFSGKAVLQFLIAGAAGLSVATFIEAPKYEKDLGVTGRWEIMLKMSPIPLSRVSLHAPSGQVALLASNQNEFSIWGLSTLLSPGIQHLGEPEGEPGGPLCLHQSITDAPLLTCTFTPDGKLVLLIHKDRVFTLHNPQKSGLV